VLTLPSQAVRVSSAWTAFYKRLFPFLWYGVLLLITVIQWNALQARREFLPLILVVPVVMALIGYFVMKIFIADLMDDVWDNGDELIVLNDGHVEHVPLKDIVNISYMGFTNPARATLSLRHPGRWGAKITFSPQRRFLSFLSTADHPLIEDLIQRVDAARNRARTDG
jgi:hypothetical protein